MAIVGIVAGYFIATGIWPDDEGMLYFGIFGGAFGGYLLGAALGYALVLVVPRLPKRRTKAEYDGYDDYENVDYDDYDRPRRRREDC
jgi:hypothetical protein